MRLAPGWLRNWSLLRAAAPNAELGKLRRDDLPVRRRIDLLVDMEDAPVESDEEGPTLGKWLVFVDNTISRGDSLRRIAQQGVINAQRLCKGLVGFRIIDTDRKIRDVEPPDLFATLTE